MGSFDRVAYYMELVKASGATQWVYVSMTAFTTNATRLGIPRNYILRHNAYDTANPSNATIRSNVSGITNTNGCNTVNLEFWPSNYGGGNDYGVPGADAGTYDFGDGGAGTSSGHSSMQIHNYGAKQTLFAYNAWAGTGTSNLGLGNCPTPTNGGVDWTFDTANISTYTVRTLQILVRTLGVSNLPATNVTASSGWMNAQLTAASACDVYAFWGATDQGTNSSLWAHSALLGSYPNGTCDLTRQVTGLTGGATNWYTFFASNAAARVWGTPSRFFVTATTPSVDNGAGAAASVGQAVLRGNLTAGGTADLYVYWGPNDGGVSANYANVVKMTDVPQGAFSTTVSALNGFPYYYICCASNEAGVAWAPASTTFALPAPAGTVSYSLGLRGSVFQPMPFAQSAVDLSGSSYTISSTRVLTGSKAGTVLATNEVPGRNIVLAGPATTWNEFGGSPGDNFVAALSGRFFPPVTGTYSFRWSHDDRGWLFMDTGDDGVFDSADTVGNYAWDGAGSRTLTAGQGYNFMLVSHESAGGDSLNFWYTPPGGVETYVNPSAQTGQWRYASSLTPAASIANTPASTLTASAATLNGDLYGRGYGFDVYACWGTADGGNVAANWQTSTLVGRYEDWDGPVSVAISGLATNELYYYTFFVSNGLMTAWAASSETFATDAVTLEATDASASETGPDTGTFRVTRPDTSTNGALTVSYTLSGTAANGTDYTTLTGSVVIPAGATSAEFVVAPLDDLVWQEGAETVTATLAAGDYLIGAASSAVVTIQDGDASPSSWFLRMPLQFAGYNRAEMLTNFPALVVLDTGLAGFSYSQFLSGANGDLRFTDGSMTRELAYEIESWNPAGQSRVWVQIPAFTNNVTIWMLWRRAGLTAPAYTANGATWSAGYVSVAHLSESNGTVANSALVGSVPAVSGVPVQAVPGAIGTGVRFDGLDDQINFGTVGRTVDNFTFSAWLSTANGHERDAQSNSGTAGTAGQRYAFDPEQGSSSANNSVAVAGLSAGTNGLSVYEHTSGYMPALAVYSNMIGSGWNFVTVTYLNRQPRIYCNGALVCTGVTSAKSPVNAPYRVGVSTANYGNFEGFMDEIRISAVPRSANWIWAEYMNAASNGTFATAGAVLSADYPEIANQAASGVSASAATLNGYLSATGMAETAVAVYWGTQDGGTDAGTWANTNWFAAPAAPGAFSKDLTGLASGTAYYYRFAATNASATVWASASETLLTGPVSLQATDASAAEEPADAGTFTVSRGAAQDGPLTVSYTLSGTGVSGVDFGTLSGSVTIPDGATSATITVTPLFNRNYLVRATDTVTLTLAAGGYISEGPDSGTVTITNWQPTSAVGIDVPRNFFSSSAAPLTGSETLAKTSAGQMMVGGSSGNTFTGDIVVETDGGLLRVGAIPGASSGIGVTLPGMTAANTITVKRGGTLQIEDNANGAVGSAPNRFGTEGNRPSVALAGGTLTLNGGGNATTVPQNLNTLSLGSGYNVVTANRNAGTPQLVLSSVTQAKGSHVNFTGTSLGTATNNAPQIRFTTPPALVGGSGAVGTTTMSLMPGARYGSEWVAYFGSVGVRPLITAEYNGAAGNDINGVGATENVKITGTTPAVFPPLLADKTVNSLNINVAANVSWTPTNKLTLTSGQLISGVPNNNMAINYPSTLTAGSGTSDASLDISVFQATTTIRSLITDNGSGKVTLTKNGGGTLTLDSSVDNTYSGGTYVNEGVLTTGGGAGRRYLGPLPVRVDAAQLTLGQVGATANTSGYDYTAVNGAEIGVATFAYTAEDTFFIESGSVIYGNASLGIGLNSLDRGLGVPGATPNIILGSDAIIAHSAALSAPLSVGTNTIKNLGTSADLYYGLVSDQFSVAGAITVGSNTPFKGLSTDRYDRRWYAGTINVAPGTSDIWLQGMIRPGTTPANLYLGYWLNDGGPVIAPSGVGELTANVLGSVILSDTFALYGDTSAGRPVTFAVKAGATLAVERPGAMGTGTGIASARVEDGGTLSTWTPAGVNGAVTVKAGGRFQANNAGGLTGTGAVTFENGSILEISTALGFSGTQADAIAAALPPGQLLRLNADYYGSAVETLDSHLGSKALVYEVYNGDRRPVNPIVPNTTVMTLNRDAATGAGGMLVNDWSSRTFAAAPDGLLVIGPNGAAIAATSNTTLYVTQPLALGANALTIGATSVLDRVLLPKLGTVQFNSGFGQNTALPGSSITVIPGATLINNANTLPDAADLTVNGAFLVGGAETVGSLAGSGWVNLQGNSLTVGRNNNSSTFSGALTNTSVAALFTKTGTGRLDVTSAGHPYSGMFTVNDGVLAFSGNGAMATPAGVAAFNLMGNGTLALDNSAVNNGDRLAGISSGVTFQGGTFRFTGKNGEASGESLGAALFLSGASTIDMVNGTGAGSSAEVVFDAAVPSIGTVNFTASNGTLGEAGDNPRVLFNGLGAGLLGYATVGGVPAYYDTDTGVRAFTLAEGTEFDGTADQTGLDTTYTAANLHAPLDASRAVNSLWIDNPGAAQVVNLGSSGANSLSLGSGRLTLTGGNDFGLTRSGTSSGALTRSANGTLFLGVDAGRTLTVGVPIANGAGLLEKDGAGALVLSATNTFTGALTINAGAVRYAAGLTGDLNANSVNIWNSGVLDFAGDTDTLGNLSIYSGGLTNSAANGALTVAALTLGGGPAGSSTYVNTGTGSLKLTGTGNVTYNALNDPDKATIVGTLDMNGASRTFIVNNSAAPGAAVDMDVSAVLSGGAGYNLTKNGAGVLRLSGANTFNGNVNFANDSGSVILAHPQALGSPSFGRTITVGNNDSLLLDGAAGNIAISANYTNLFLNGGGDGLMGAIRGALISVSGSNTVPCSVYLNGGTYLASLQAGGTLVLSGAITGVQDLSVYGAGDTVLGGAIITGAKVLVKNGSGTLTLNGTGTNTFSNTTTVNAGKLVLAKANGTTAVNAIANGAVNIANGAVLQYAASSANPDLMGTGAVGINGVGQLDFNGASDTIGAVTVNASGATAETTNILNTAGGGNLTVTSLAVTPAPGLLTRMNTGTGTLTLGGNVTFTASANGRALISGNVLALGGATRTLTIGQGLYTNYDLAIDAVISGGTGFGLTKAGTGILRLDAANTFDGNLTVGNSSGTVILGNSQALGTPSVTRTVSIGTADTLALDGVGIADPNNRIALSLNGTGDIRFGGVSGALVNLAGSNTVPCAVALAGNTQIASKQAGGKLTLTGAFTGAYTLTVAGPGETAFAGANGAIPSATAITVSSNGVLTLENTALANNANRIGTVPVTLAGGSFRFSNDGGAAHFTETVGALTIGAGSNLVFAAQAASGQTSALVFASIANAGGTVNFTGTGLGESAQNRIFITGQADGMIGPWAFINGTNLAMYSSAQGVYAGSGAEVGVAALGGTAQSVIPHNESASAVINTMGSEGPITLEALWTNRVLEVRQETAYASVVAMTNDTAMKALQTSRLMIKAGQESLTIGETENVGALMALSSGGTLALENWNASETLTVNAAVPNNNAASGLAKFGPGTVLLTGSNSYSGATLVNEGNLEFGSSFAQKLSGVISGAGTLVKSGTNQLHLTGANTFTGPLYVNAGIVRPDQNTAFGTTASGVTIANGATLDLGCDAAVGGTRTGEQLYLNLEEFTVGGAGVGGAGAIVNNGNLSQMSAVQRVLLSGDTTFGGKNRWDIRSGVLFMNDHTLTKTGACEIALVSIPVYPGSGRMIVNQNLLRFESSLLVNGSASNSVTVNKGARLELYNLSPFVPLWSLILNEGSFFQGSGTVFTTNMNHWAGPVKLNGRTFVNGSVASIQWSIDGDVSGAGTLVKAGISSATLWLTGTNNTYSGGTIVSNGTLYAKYPASLPGYNDGRLTLANDGFVAMHASDGTFGFTAENIRDLAAASVFTTNTAGISIDTSMSALDYGYGFSRGPMALAKQGTNTLTLSGTTNTYSGNTYVNGGTLRFSSTVGTNNLNKLYLGYNVTNAAAVVQEGGLTDVGSTIGGSETLAVGSGGTGSYGYYRKNGGTLTTGWLSVPGNNGYNGVFEQYGGDTFVTGSWLIMGWINVNNGASAINLFGGTLRNPAAGNEISMNHNASRNTFNMINLLGPTAVLDANTSKSLRLATTGTNLASVVNLNAGSIVATRVYAGVTTVPSIFNFNGGTLRASAPRTDFLQGLTAATVYPGGAVFDTAGSDVTVNQPLLAPLGYGLTYVPLRSNGAGYVGTPVVVVTGGSGTGATAIASVDVTDGSPTKGKVTGISVTSPGSGYLSSDKLTVSLLGGGTLSPAVTNDCVLGLNDASGGLTKLGLGTLMLTATNTYGGATVISNGMLQLAVAQALPTGSVVRVDGGVLNMGGYAITNRSLAVTAGSVINGRLVCDSVVKTGSGKWTLGTSLSSATPIIVAEGTLKLQAGQPGLYEGTLSGAFDTTTSASVCSNVTVQLSTRMANTNLKQPTGLWGDFMTIVYSGYIWNRTGANATWTFGESVDDSTQVKIDSTVVINGGGGWDVPTIGTYTLTPGAHAFEVRFGNGPGGAGLVPNKMWWTSSTLGFGIDYQGHTATNTLNLMTNFVACTDPGDGSLFSCTAASSGSTNLIAATTSMVLGEGTLLDLDGYVQTLKDLSGSGTVSNGTLSLTGTIAPGGTNVVGTMTIARNTTLNSGKLLVDVAGDSSDRLIVQGNANLGNMTLEIEDPDLLDRTKVYTILTCTGMRTGKLTPTNLPSSHWHVIYRADGAVQLIFVNGTLIRLR